MLTPAIPLPSLDDTAHIIQTALTPVFLLAGVANLDDLLWATVHQIALMLKVRVVILLPEGLAAVKAARNNRLQTTCNNTKTAHYFVLREGGYTR